MSTPIEIETTAAGTTAPVEAPLVRPAFYVGIDGVTPLTWPVEGYARFFDFLAEKNGLPSWIGRYIGSYTKSYNLTAAEVALAHANGIAILLVYDGATPITVGGDYEGGIADANTAAIAAKALGAPADNSIAIYVDIESGWPVSVGYLAGWHVGLLKLGFLGGVYGNPRDAHFNSIYSTAYNSTPAMHGYAYIWSSEDELNSYRTTPPAAFTPARTSANGSNVVVWQYLENDLDDLIDRDYATAAGYDLMWQAIFTVLTNCSLKSEPSHTSGVATANVPAGTQVRRLNTIEPDWDEVVTPHGYRGYLLKSNLQAK